MTKAKLKTESCNCKRFRINLIRDYIFYNRNQLERNHTIQKKIKGKQNFGKYKMKLLGYIPAYNVSGRCKVRQGDALLTEQH